MCEECRNIAAEHIMDYVNLDLHLAVAIRLERESVMRHALLDMAGQEAIDTALGLAKVVDEVGAELAAIAEFPHYWDWLLAKRRAEVAAEASEAET